MKTEIEIQRAHDLLVGLILGEVPHEYSKEEMVMIDNDASVLCWILDHTHNNHFQENIKSIEQHMKDNGYVLSRRDN